MTFDDSLTWLNSTQIFGIKLGLDNTRRLLGHLGNPEQKLRIIHVAGTNGKGSVCAMLDSVFRAACLKSGLYTSPHLCDFRERVLVNGTMISRESAADILTRLHDFCRDWPHSPTFFEISTALALAHFASEDCDVVILETGMGGTLDATNAVTPVVSVITPIAMDHAEWLGDSISKIAAEKAGIIKPGVPVVSAPQTGAAAEVLRARAAECGSQLTFVEQPYEGEIGLEGGHQKWNASLAVAALKISGPASSHVEQASRLLVPLLNGSRDGRPTSSHAPISTPEAAIKAGLRDVNWPARFQRIGDRIILDGAHNPHAARALVEAWRNNFGPQNPTIIFGAMKDKDYREMLAILSTIASSFLFVPVVSPRSSDPAELLKCTPCPAQTSPSLSAAIASAMAKTQPVLITGSLFLAGEAIDILARKTPQLRGAHAGRVS
ncbi:MAG: bifunctional folylpolyglutamate synthase/dihydrofolate synthase [Verrucomicrobia bacterium]|nr:bifunctional folylpolyglutamate synthase/dihydrofolate synthase [Verrucomicrobiota bacterium]